MSMLIQNLIAALTVGLAAGSSPTIPTTTVTVREAPGNDHAVVGFIGDPDCQDLESLEPRKIDGLPWNKVRASNGTVGWAYNYGFCI